MQCPCVKSTLLRIPEIYPERAREGEEIDDAAQLNVASLADAISRQPIQDGNEGGSPSGFTSPS